MGSDSARKVQSMQLKGTKSKESIYLSGIDWEALQELLKQLGASDLIFRGNIDGFKVCNALAYQWGKTIKSNINSIVRDQRGSYVVIHNKICRNAEIDLGNVTRQPPDQFNWLLRISSFLINSGGFWGKF